jgi:hypothetical protein|tara:strand:+ start:930 stop:1154 length:225 start_codon:yes stop_codon:yes gene_type:complete
MTRIKIDGAEYQLENDTWTRSKPLDDFTIDEILGELELVRPRTHQFTVDAVAEIFPQMEVIEADEEDLQDTFPA